METTTFLVLGSPIRGAHSTGAGRTLASLEQLLQTGHGQGGLQTRGARTKQEQRLQTAYRLVRFFGVLSRGVPARAGKSNSSLVTLMVSGSESQVPELSL